MQTTGGIIFSGWLSVSLQGNPKNLSHWSWQYAKRDLSKQNTDLQSWLFFVLNGITSLTVDFTAVGLTVNATYSLGVLTGKKICVSREEWHPVSVTVKSQTYQHYFDRNDFVILSHWRPEFSSICQRLNTCH